MNRTARAQSAAGAAWLRAPLRLLSPGGPRGRLSVVIFHRVRDRPDPLFAGELDAVAFADRMQWLASWFNVIPLGDAVTALARGTLPERALAITFDDGYADNVTAALPILQRLRLHATFFIATGYIGGGTMWNDIVIEAVRRAPRDSMLDLTEAGLGVHDLASDSARRRAIDMLLGKLKYRPTPERDSLARQIAAASGATMPDDLMMTRAQLCHLAASGMGIGAHTSTHPILALLDAAEARREMAEGREALEAIIRVPVTLFAYPNGKPGVDYQPAHVSMARQLGFAAALSTARGAARCGDPPYELPRFTPWDRTPTRFGLRLARNLMVLPEGNRA